MKIFMENWRRFLAESKEDIVDKIKEIKFNSASALKVFRDEGTLAEAERKELDYEVSLAENPDEEAVEAFYDSLYGGKRAGFLSPYSHDELRMMDLYKLKGHNAGFAIKDGDDIVSVHNNSDLSGLGREFMTKAKEVGGRRLDHFDGFLSGLYRKYGFTDVYEIYQWDEQYAPDAWNFEKVNIMDPFTSVYAEALESLAYDDPDALPDEAIEVEAEDDLKIDINPNLKYNSYKYGRPDVIMRRLG
jgi:hypothetical protein